MTETRNDLARTHSPKTKRKCVYMVHLCMAQAQRVHIYTHTNTGRMRPNVAKHSAGSTSIKRPQCACVCVFVWVAAHRCRRPLGASSSMCNSGTCGALCARSLYGREYTPGAQWRRRSFMHAAQSVVFIPHTTRALSAIPPHTHNFYKTCTHIHKTTGGGEFLVRGQELSG